MTRYFNITAKLIGLCCFFFIHIQAEAQQYSYAGTVLDYDTRQPIEGLMICSDTLNQNCVFTDLNGSFIIQSKDTLSMLKAFGLGYDRMLEAFGFNDSARITYYLKQDGFEMSSALVVGILNKSIYSKVPATIGMVSSGQLMVGDASSLQAGLNTLPGVTLETRGQGGSQRLNIRGSFLRSPFAVRNVKTYLNGIPFSSPDGSSPLELIDASDVEKIEVVKGPAGSIYGSATGGVLNISTLQPLKHGFGIKTTQQYGGFGLRRSVTQAQFVDTKWSVRVSHIFQQNQGYRDQEWNKKNQASAFIQYRPMSKLKYFLYLAYYNGSWALPGALNATEAEEDPRQARPFSIENNAALFRKRTMIGFSQHWEIDDKWSNQTSIYAQQTDKTNPYGTSAFSQGYKEEGATGAGMRTVFTGKMIATKMLQARLNVGAEYQFEKFNITEWDNEGGKAGDEKYHYDVNYHGLLGFASIDWELGRDLLINTGVSWNKTIHQAKGYAVDGIAFDTTATWAAELLPRLGASYQWIKNQYVVASVSYGNSQPTVFEQIDYENNRFNLDLKPEHGINYEGGLKGSIGQRFQLEYEVTAYQFLLNDAILAEEKMNADSTVFTAYSNTGSTKQEGIEWTLRKRFALGDSLEHSLAFWLSGAFQRYRFDDYSVSGVELAGNHLPGVPPATFSSGFQLSLWDNNFSWSLSHYWMDRVFLNNANNVYGKAYHLLHTRVGLKVFSRRSGFTGDVFVGIQNLTNTVYTSFYAFNGAAGRYYNPSQPRSLFFGFTLGL